MAKVIGDMTAKASNATRTKARRSDKRQKRCASFYVVRENTRVRKQNANANANVRKNWNEKRNAIRCSNASRML